MTVTALDDARSKLGGSTIAAACGIDPYCSPIRLWLELTGQVAREETEAMRWGKALQPLILDALVEAQPLWVAWAGGPGGLTDPARPWLVGHPDALAWDDDRDDGVVVEAKARAYPSDLARPAAEAQLQTYLHLTGYGHGVLATLTALHLDVAYVERHQPTINLLLELAERFMGYVHSGEMPSPHGHPDDRHALLLAHPEAVPGRQVRETRAVHDARLELRRLLAAEKVRTERIERLKATITAYMGDAEVLLNDDDAEVAAWRNTTSRRLDVAALKKEVPVIYDEYAVPTTTRRLTL